MPHYFLRIYYNIYNKYFTIVIINVYNLCNLKSQKYCTLFEIELPFEKN